MDTHVALHLLDILPTQHGGRRVSTGPKTDALGKSRGCEWKETELSPIFHPAGEALIEPQVIPPHHSDEVPEPLMCQLVSHHHGHPLLGVH